MRSDHELRSKKVGSWWYRTRFADVLVTMRYYTVSGGMIMRRLVLSCVLLFTCSVFAQSNNAIITGQVTDTTKAVLPQTKVVAINAGTGIRYERQTDSSGTYTIPQLPPGTYRIEVEKIGFKSVVKPDVVLQMQAAVVINFEMARGSASGN